jgi:hypothetical protein
VEEIMVDCDYALYFWPFTLKEEEEAAEKLRSAPRTEEGGVILPLALCSSTMAKKMCGWEGIYQDDEQEVPLAFDKAWENGKVPDNVIQAFDMGVRTSSFAFLLSQAAGNDEVSVGKPG